MCWLPHPHLHITQCDAAFSTGKEQSVEKHFNRSELPALMDSSISAASSLPVLSVRLGESCRGKSKGKIDALGAIFYIHVSHSGWYSALLSFAKLKDPPVRRGIPTLQKLLPVYHTSTRRQLHECMNSQPGEVEKVCLDFLLQAFCKAANRENLANEMRVKTMMKQTPFPTLPSGENAMRSLECNGNFCIIFFALFPCVSLA